MKLTGAIDDAVQRLVAENPIDGWTDYAPIDGTRHEISVEIKDGVAVNQTMKMHFQLKNGSAP